MSIKTTRVQCFTLPGDEALMENILNDSDCDIIDKKEYFNPKESVLLVKLEWEEYKVNKDTTDLF